MSSITPSMDALKANAATTIAAFKSLSGNATQIASHRSDPAFVNPPTVDVKSALVAWSDATNAAKADFQSLATCTSDFVTSMNNALNATYESARFDPLWDLIGRLTTLNLGYNAAFKTMLTNAQNWAQAYDTATAGTTTPDPVRPLFDNLPALTTAASSSVDFIKAYKVALSQDVASVLLWAGSDSASSEELPLVLNTYKASGTSDYSIVATLFTQLATLDYGTSS